ncbi:MAG TPA: transglutaminase-like domain-containing protein [Chroococcidiopsis sp.]
MLFDPSLPTLRLRSAETPVDFNLLPRMVSPIGVYALRGLAVFEETLLALDSVRGYVVQINPLNDDVAVLNPHHVNEFIDATGIALSDEKLWFCRDQSVYWCTLSDFSPKLFVKLPYPVDGVAVWRSTVYVTCQKSGYIQIFDADTARLITRFALPGVGEQNLTVRDEELWLCDRIEQMVYCMDRATGELRFSILTPFVCPTGLAFYRDSQSGKDVLYVSYAQEEAYIRDDPNSEPPLQVAYRDRTFIHPLHFRYEPAQHYTLSNGYLIEMSYVEEILPLEEIEIEHLEWRIALPADTPRQKVLSVEPIGLPFVEEVQDGQRVAVFKFDKLMPHEGRLFGWKALMEMRGIKYWFEPHHMDRLPPLSVEFQNLYLIDDDELAMDTPTIKEAAKVAIGTETNLLRKILKIRNYVYDRLSYALTTSIDAPDVVLERGTGSCGEYVGLLLALARLNGIACRTVGRYKCPPFGDRQGVPLEPDFNHVWIEFYVPGFGWLPMESNVDDIVDGGPYPTRFFMGLPWWHAEMAKGIPFETLRSQDGSIDVSIGELAINHVRFKILAELPPLE